MKLLDRYRAFTYKETIIQTLAKISQRFFESLKYAENILPYSKTVNALLSKGFKIRRVDKKTVEISINENKYLIRRYGSDMKVFEQVVVNEEYKQLLNLVDKVGLQHIPLTVLDCGSNIGLFSAWILNHVKVKKIISIESDTDNYTFQKYFIDKMKYESKIELVNSAIWSDSDIILEISTAFRDGLQWARSVVPATESYTNQVKSITLNQVFDDYLDQEVHILKIDIEGAEKAVFGNEESLDRMLRNARIIAIEIHEEVESTAMIMTILHSYGFILEKIGETTFGYKR